MSEIKNHTGNALVRRYYDTLSETVGRENLERFLNGEITYLKDAPFLSVIMRTRGNRPEALAEVLLCLSGQSDLDFEVLIMGHNLDDNGRNTVNGIISELPDYMDGKVRLCEVTGGNRTTPLNEGFKAAKGRYISILDDDDLVFDNWVESFHSLEEGNAGKIFHSYCAAQDWKVSQNADGENILTSISAFKTMYCVPFEMLEQLSTNRCPTFSLAFPSYVYNVLNIHFDETLTTTEDWDFLMRCAFICGVADIPNLTGVYRLWVNAESSATLHSRREWKKNHTYIQDKFKTNAVLIPKEELGGLMYNADSGSQDNAKIREVMVIADDGTGFGAHKPFKLEFTCENGRWTTKCVNISKVKGIKALRLDPVASGTVTVTDFAAKLVDENGNDVGYTVDKKRTNGVFVKNKIVFMGDDPQIRVDLLGQHDLSLAEFSFEILYDVPENFFRFPIIKYLIKRWAGAVYRRVRAVFRKIKH